jgi:Ran GTPase-activating protein (RanGAP) involved in mRNA processing and transport
MAQLTELKLFGNKIGDEGMTAFSTALASGVLVQLTCLDFDNNQIGDVGMKAFSTALTSGALPQLKELHLGSNQIGDEGMKSFSTALDSGAPKIHSLSGEYNLASAAAIQAARAAINNRK